MPSLPKRCQVTTHETNQTHPMMESALKPCPAQQVACQPTSMWSMCSSLPTNACQPVNACSVHLIASVCVSPPCDVHASGCLLMPLKHWGCCPCLRRPWDWPLQGPAASYKPLESACHTHVMSLTLTSRQPCTIMFESAFCCCKSTLLCPIPTSMQQ